MSKIFITVTAVISVLGIGYLASCNKNDYLVYNNIVFKPTLSVYGIYTGNPRALIPSASYHLYELSTPLFSDYAEKQRLIRLPVGSKLITVDDGLPNFPDSTIIVKTFYYFNNKTDTSLGKKIIETRLLIKYNGKWNAATYMWNNEQTDAILVSAGVDVPLNWIDERGEPKVIYYHIPSKIECGMCHQSDKNIIPIGPKIRNLNMDIIRNGSTINQLQHLQNIGIMAQMNPASFGKLPNWKSGSYALEERARAYLDVNCGHCHNNRGFASNSSLRLTYETSLGNSHIRREKNVIDILMSRGTMPLIGTTIIDKEGLQLIQKYLQTL